MAEYATFWPGLSLSLGSSEFDFTSCTLCNLWHASSTEDIPQTAKRLEVLITGAGIAGLTLAILIEKASVLYEVCERAAEDPLYISVSASHPFSAKWGSCTSNGVFDQTPKLSFVIDVKESEEIREKGDVGVACHGVTIRFSDSSGAEGDILVGTDEAYSGVGQSLYQRLERERKLPASDVEDLR
ncbi:hypothetical protein EDD21DRAFT_421197 [Dissophora ornata]|nr:hypothetical protein EDD21DRAFT_421197 [Dissophora ornata]